MHSISERPIDLVTTTTTEFGFDANLESCGYLNGEKRLFVIYENRELSWMWWWINNQNWAIHLN